ncbi:MAG: hypothetical protein N0C88_16925 [Candidatus Thiodiazotropha lotti]|uniref:Uncharacterized protein n=1 Tax=Candidatus Thiodiazotropha lotti TaxID=2792787 RepID=A0A9E4K6K3_9GAMM|nr:hypothetical protein [Candidatus Thiodiazotropha lotti]MCG7940512.1 hypothetical protein [Candidatus Thiodiazotropha lotti]MCW4204986.1 hypothetical protein [Candidatus Thiodiazotropha lotti]MCW4222396.1 hypothetical protein [Candidatus Thiodiazotropha lotti]
MYKKKLLTLMVASLLPLSAEINAEEALQEGGGMAQSEAGEAVETVEAAATGLAPIVSAEAQTAEAAAAAEPESDQSESMGAEMGQSEAAGGDQATEPAAEAGMQSEPVADAEAATAMDDAYTQRWKERETRYQELRNRAEEAGVMLPAHPPWRMSQMEANRPSMDERRQHHEKMMNMSPEERDAYRQERYQKMREQAKQQGIEMSETPPWVARKKAMEEEWAKHQAVIEGMTDEERAACHAMHRRHMGHGMGRGHGMGPGHGKACGQGCQGPYGNPGAMPAPRYPGYGYGPAPYGQGNFWDPSY